MTRLPVVGQPLMDGRGVLVPGIDDRGNLDRRQRLLMRLYENSDVAAGVFLRVTTGGQNEVNLDWTLPPETLATCASIEVYRLDPGLVAVDPGAVFSIAYGNHSGTPENHYHANAAGTAPGLPVAGLEIGGLFPPTGTGGTEICRGLCEFKVTSYPADIAEARLRFKVRDVSDVAPVQIGGLHGQLTAYQGPIDIEAYAADNVDSPADFDAPTLATLASAINTTGAIVDQEYDIDVTALYQAARAQSESVGFRLKTPTEPIDDDTAITFYEPKLDVTAGVPNLVHTETDCNVTSWQDTLLTEGQEYCYFIVVKDSGGDTIDRSNTDCAYAGLVPSITPIPDRTDDIGDTIDVTFTATGTAPITWSAENLPPSLSIASDGRVTGTLNAVGDYTVHVRATNVIGLDHTTFVWSVVRLAPIVNDPGPQTDRQYDSANLQMTLSQGTEPVSWSATDLPPGLSIGSASGLIFGTFTTPGNYMPTVTATNSTGTDDVVFTWDVTEVLAPIIVNPGNQSGTQGDTISLPMTLSQGTAPIDWSALSLPTGLTINTSTGLISGTLDIAGSWSPIVNASNPAGSDAVTFDWDVAPFVVIPIVNNPGPQTDTEQDVISLQMTLQQGSLPVTWSAINLPPGLSINESTGLISGTATDDGSYSPTVRATNAGGFGDVSFSWTINPLAVTIQDPGPQSNEVNVAVNLQMVASSGSIPISWSATGLPTGLSISSTTGLISGVPTAVNVFNATITATNAAGPTNLPIEWTIFAIAPIVIDPGTQNSAEGEVVSVQMAVSQGSQPITWSAVGLPDGTSINSSTGLISGTTTTIGTFNPTVTATNAGGSDDQTFQWGVGAVAPIVVNPGNQSGTDGDVVSLQMTTTQGSAPLTWSAINLPPTLSIDSGTGEITGTLTAAGQFNNVQVTVSNVAGSDAAVFNWTVAAVAPIIIDPLAQTNDDNDVVSLQVTLSQGSAPITWGAVNLPPGLSINTSTGQITGTITDFGTFNPTVTATNSAGSDNSTFQWTVNPVAPVVVNPGNQTNAEGDTVSLQMTTSGGSDPTGWSATGLPTGLSINTSTGLISGTPTAYGDFLNVTVTATNVAGSGQTVFNWTITGFVPVVVDPGDQTGTEGDSISLFMTTSQGSPTITWSAIDLPDGLSINTNTGEISGTLDQYGAFIPTVTATNALGSDDAVFNWTVNAIPPIVVDPGPQTNTNGDTVNLQMTVSQGSTPITWSAVGLPNGLSIASATGLITGTIDGVGDFTPTVTATNAGGSDDQIVNWTVTGLPPIVVDPLDQNNADGDTVNLQMTLSQGDPPVTWSAVQLPPGLSIGVSTGLISGTITDYGVYNTVVTATNDAGSDDSSFTWTVTSVAPVVVNPGPQVNDDEDTVNLQMTVSAGSTPITWSAINLPPGLSIDPADGEITGTISDYGIYNPQVTATNVAGSDMETFTWTVNELAPTVADPGTQNNTDEDVISLQMTLVSGSTPVTWTASGLPTGLAIDTNTGEITGTIADHGTFNPTVRATNGAGFDEVTFTWNVAELAPTVVNPGTQNDTDEDVISLTVTLSSGSTPVTWSAANLPPGLSINSGTGEISGTISGFGAFASSVTATNGAGFDTANFTWNVAELIPTVNNPGAQTNDDDEVVSLQMTLASGSTPVTWSATGLPPGLSIDSVTGEIAGTVSDYGIYNPNVRATNGAGFDEVTFQWTINAVLVAINNPGAQSNDTDDTVSLQMTYSAGSTPITWSEDPTNSLPPGLTIASSTGLITGTPTTEGTYSVTIRADNAAGQSTTNFSWEVTGEPIFDWGNYPNLYYRGDAAVVTEAGGLVDLWPDQTANSHDLAPTSASYKPTYVPSLVNGLPGISFTNLTTNLEHSPWTNIAQPNSIMAVIRINTLTSTRYFIDNNEAIDRHAFYQPSPENARIFAGIERAIPGGVPNEQFFIVAITYFAENSKFYVNGGTNLADGIGSIGTQDMGGLLLGTRYGGVPNPADMDLAEVIVNNGGFTTDEFNDIGNYWATKYGLSWTDIVDVATTFSPVTGDHLKAKTAQAASVVYATGGVTICCWVRKSMVSTSRECVFAVGNTADSIEIHIDATGHPIAVHQVGGLKAAAVSNHAVDDGVWHLITARFHSAVSRDIQVDTNTPESDTTDVGSLPAVAVVALGRNEEGLTYEGDLDECAYFDAVLTQADTSAMHAGKMLAVDIVSGEASLPSAAKPDHAWNLSANNQFGRGQDVGTAAATIPCDMAEEGSPSTTDGINAS